MITCKVVFGVWLLMVVLVVSATSTFINTAQATMCGMELVCLVPDMVETCSSKALWNSDADNIAPWDVGAVCLPNPVGIQWMVSTVPDHSVLYQVSAIATPTCASRAHEQDFGYLKLEDMEYLKYEEQSAGTPTKVHARAAPKDIRDRGSCVGTESPCAAAASDVQVCGKLIRSQSLVGSTSVGSIGDLVISSHDIAFPKFHCFFCCCFEGPIRSMLEGGRSALQLTICPLLFVS